MSLLDGHVALGKELTWNTPVTTSTGLPVNPVDWDLKEEWETIVSSFRLPGQETETSTFSRVFKGITGQGAGELLDKGMGLLLLDMFGSLSSAVHPVEASMNRFTLVPTVTSKRGKSLTIQLHKAFVDDLGRAFTGSGVKVVGFKLMCDKGGNVRYAVTLDGADVATSGRVITASISTGNNVVTIANTVGLSVGMRVTGTGIPANSFIRKITANTSFELGDSTGAAANATATNASASLTVSRGTAIAKASPTYPSSPQPFAWAGLTVLTLDGAQADCTGFELSWDYKLLTDRRFMPGSGIKKEQVASGELSAAKLTLKGMEWLETNRQHDRYNSITAAGAIAAFTMTAQTAAPTAGATKASLSITVPTARAISGPPDMKGGQPADFDVLNGITVTYDTSDAAP